MGSVLEYTFTTQFEYEEDQITSPEIRTVVEIDPLNFSVTLQFSDVGMDEGPAIKVESERRYSQMIQHLTTTPLTDSLIPPEEDRVSADKVLDRHPDSDFQKSETLQRRVTPIAMTWFSDNHICKLYRSHSITQAEFEAEVLLDEYRGNDSKILEKRHKIQKGYNKAKEARSEHYHGIYWMGALAHRDRNLSPLLPPSRCRQLEATKYGDRAIRHIREADYCFELDLFLPALASYIHGIEWTIITYMQKEIGRDVIDEEKKGGHYNEYLDLVNELGDKADLDQMTMARLEALNEMRRWMAHHKSGEINETDLRNVRTRLNDLLKYLFD